MMNNLGAATGSNTGSMELVGNPHMAIGELGDDIEQVYETLSDVLTR